MDLLGPDRVERAGLGKVQQEQGQDAAHEYRSVQDGEFDGRTGGTGRLLHGMEPLGEVRGLWAAAARRKSNGQLRSRRGRSSPAV